MTPGRSLLLGALVVLTVAPGRAVQARPASTWLECLEACGPALDATCSWMPERGKYRCRSRVYRQCHRRGVAVRCPPITSTTTAPVGTTTTTTLPASPRIIDLRGTYVFQGYVTTDPCGLFGLAAHVAVPLTVIHRDGTSLVGTFPGPGIGFTPATGTYTPATGSWDLSGYRSDHLSGCSIPAERCPSSLVRTGVRVSYDGGFGTGVPAVWFYHADQALLSATNLAAASRCRAEAAGLVSWDSGT